MYTVYFKDGKEPQFYPINLIEIHAYGIEVFDKVGYTIWPWHKIDFIEYREKESQWMELNLNLR